MIPLKRKYVRPQIEVEMFQLAQSVASCATKVLFGPQGETTACGNWGFVDPFSVGPVKKASTGMIYPFYENSSCECYYSAPRDSGYFSS